MTTTDSATMPQHSTPDPTPEPASNDHLLRAFVADRSVPCPGCSYDLRALTTTTCPECNQELVLRVGLAEPRLGAFLAALIGLATGTGFSGLLIVYFVFAIILRGRGGAPGEFMVATIPPFLLEGSFLLILVHRRATFTRASSIARIAIVIAAWLVTAINLLAFSIMIR